MEMFLVQSLNPHVEGHTASQSKSYCVREYPPTYPTLHPTDVFTSRYYLFHDRSTDLKKADILIDNFLLYTVVNV